MVDSNRSQPLPHRARTLITTSRLRVGLGTFVALEAEAESLEVNRLAIAAACEAIVVAGASITHHHAVGTDHRDFLIPEIGEVGARILRAIKQEVDPSGVLNPGKLLPMG